MSCKLIARGGVIKIAIEVWPPVAACDPARKCILVVEDELLIRFMLSDGLRDEGYHVIEACNADEALVIFESVVPDMLISDVRMPGSMDGMALLKHVRLLSPSLPVVITSGHLDPAHAVREGATEFLAKPYSMPLLIQAVRSKLGEPKL